MAPAEVWLNGARLGDVDANGEFDVTAPLAERNSVEVRSAGELGDVVLEVRE
jgi:hypothetical protein